MKEKPDAIYGHFMYPNGATAVWAGERLRRPALVAVGEGTFWTLRPLGSERARRDLLPMAGAIAVSCQLRQDLIEELDLPPDSVAMFPNGVDRRKFHPRDRLAMRRKHGLPEDRFLVIYVGNFIEAKGVRRAVAAIDGLPGVSGIFVGSGPAVPQTQSVAFCGKVAHEIVPEFLSAADCFLLPSDAEGSSNATLEAMACGLPVVVSARSFNEDICDKDCAWLVEPDNVQEIRNAIDVLRTNPDLRRGLADAAFSRAAHFDIQVRARRILEWMDERIRANRSVAAPAAANFALSDRLVRKRVSPLDGSVGLGRDPTSSADTIQS
jgi:glycosyltransferase involved in cell wall biosynthesis